MFGVTYCLPIKNVKRHYGINYLRAERDLDDVFNQQGFTLCSEGLYTSPTDDYDRVTQLMHRLHSIDWFRKSVVNIQAFEIKEWLNFTGFVKSGSLPINISI